MVLRMVNRVRLTWIILTVREVLSASLSTTRSACLHVEGKQNSSFSTYTYALAAPPKCSKDVPVCRVSQTRRIRPRAYHRHQNCTFNMRTSGPVHPGWIRLTVFPPNSSMTLLQSSQSVPVWAGSGPNHSSLVHGTRLWFRLVGAGLGLLELELWGRAAG